MHSEGPWEVYENSVRTVAPGRCVARMDWDVRDATDDANARLIAAAPELLEALCGVLYACGQSEGMGFDDKDCPYYKARAAIAKATNNQ